MRQSYPIGLVTDLQKALRNPICGVAAIADATEDMLELASNLLPEPIRKLFRDALSAVENAGKRLVSAPIDA